MSISEKAIRLEVWINKLQSLGKNAFSLPQALSELPSHSEGAIKNALNRLSKKGVVLSIHKGYYLIIGPQHSAWGIQPAVYFIDGLMKFLERPYYVALLSAAALHGAAHQQPQEFNVIVEPPALRPTKKKRIKINYFTKTSLPQTHLVLKKTETGYIKVSSPELTALDLFQYEKKIGGLNRIGTILNELIEVFDKGNINQDYIQLGSVSSIQRLGYVLEKVVKGEKYADKLYQESQKAKLKFTRIPLQNTQNGKGFSSENRWKIIANTTIEIDE